MSVTDMSIISCKVILVMKAIANLTDPVLFSIFLHIAKSIQAFNSNPLIISTTLFLNNGITS